MSLRQYNELDLILIELMQKFHFYVLYNYELYYYIYDKDEL